MSPSATTTSSSATGACGRVLKRLDLNRPSAAQCYKRHQLRWKRDEQPLPGHQVQPEVTFIQPLPGSRRRHDQFIASTTAPALGVLRIYPSSTTRPRSSSSTTSWSGCRLGVEVIQTDNGAEFQSRLHWHVLDKGIGHVDIKAHTPRRNGKVERSHRIDAEEFSRLLDGVVIDDAEVFNDKLREWENFSSYHRPHGGPGGQTPGQTPGQTRRRSRRSTSSRLGRHRPPRSASPAHSHCGGPSRPA